MQSGPQVEEVYRRRAEEVYFEILQVGESLSSAAKGLADEVQARAMLGLHTSEALKLVNRVHEIASRDSQVHLKSPSQFEGIGKVQRLYSMHRLL